MDDKALLNRHEIQIESLLKESGKMNDKISDIDKAIASLSENVVMLGQIQSQIVDINKKLSDQGESMLKLESERKLAYANTSNDIKNINSRLDSGMEHFKRLDTSIEKIEKNNSEQYKKMVYWFAGIVGTLIIGYIASKLGLKV